jgi:oxygen-dependent protoporphyrinogen oxidase
MKSPVDVLVIGAGISGLALTYKLKKQGKDVVLLDAADRPGGLVKTAYTDWGQLEMGPRGLRLRGEGGQAFLELVKDLSLEPHLIGSSEEAASRHILWEGKLEKVEALPWKWPFSKVTSGLLGALFQEALGIRSFRNFLHELARKSSPASELDLTIEDFLTQRFGYELYKRLFEPALLGVFAASGHHLSTATCLEPLWQTYQASGSLVRGMIFKKLGKIFKEPSLSLAPWDKYPLVSFDKGLQVLVDALSQQTRSSFYGRQKVNRLSWDPKLEIFRVQSSSQMWMAKRVVVACSPWSLGYRAIDLLHWDPFISHMQPQSLAWVHLGWNKPLEKAWGFGYLIPPETGKGVLGVVMDSNIFPQHDRGNIARMTVMMTCEAEDLEKAAQKSIEKVRQHLNETDRPVFIRHSIADKALALYKPQFKVSRQKLFNEIEEKQWPLSFLGMGYGSFSFLQCLAEVKRLRGI